VISDMLSLLSGLDMRVLSVILLLNTDVEAVVVMYVVTTWKRKLMLL
jgi:hypothetical protein